MAEVLSMWLPILVCAVVLFIACNLAWTVSPHHKGDVKGLENEDAMLQYIRDNDVAPGQYMLPYCADWSQLKDPEKKKRYEAGPHGLLNVWPGLPNMGRNMALTFLFLLFTSFYIGYLLSLARDPSDSFMAKFQVAGATGVLAYCFAGIPNAIWFAKPCRALCMDLVDGVVYGVITGVIFGLLW